MLPSGALRRIFMPRSVPRGVMPRFLYSVAAIVAAFFLVAASPLGLGMSHAEAYARQGMFAALSTPVEEPYRWRSLDRWADRASLWWSSWAGSLSSVLVLVRERAGSRSLEDLVRTAVAHHVRWESAR